MVILNLGCGKTKKDGEIGVDKIKFPCVDIVHNCEKGLPFEDNYADEILSWDFIEHIHQDKVIHLMNEIWRVLKPGGIFRFKIPDAEKGQGAFQDITHRSFWVCNSFKYYENNYYHDMYGIKAKFKIGQLESVKYEIDYWGENYALVGFLVAEKENEQASDSKKFVIPKIETVEATISQRGQTPMRVFTTDDVCPSNLKYFEYWDRVKQKYPELKLIAFTISRKDDKEEEDVSKSNEFNEWFESHKSWVEVQPHGLYHIRPQLGWLPYEEQKECILKSIEILKSYLPNKIIYRFPGFRTLPYSEKILRECGVSAVAHHDLIKFFDGRIIGNIVNTHCFDQFENPIVEVWNKL